MFFTLNLKRNHRKVVFLVNKIDVADRLDKSHHFFTRTRKRSRYTFGKSLSEECFGTLDIILP